MRALPCLPVRQATTTRHAEYSTKTGSTGLKDSALWSPAVRLYIDFNKGRSPFYFEYAFVACGCPASLTAISSRILPTKATMTFLALFTCTTSLVLALALRYSDNQISFKRKYKLPPRVPGIPSFRNTFQIPRHKAGA